MSNISHKSNTKINLFVNYFKYFLPLKHKKIKTQIFSQTQNHNLLFAKYYKYSQQFKHRIMHATKNHEKCSGMNFLQVKQFMLARKLFVGRITKELLQLMDVSIFT